MCNRSGRICLSAILVYASHILFICQNTHYLLLPLEATIFFLLSLPFGESETEQELSETVVWRGEDGSYVATVAAEAQVFLPKVFALAPKMIRSRGKEGTYSRAGVRLTVNKFLSHFTLINRSVGGEEKQSLFTLLSI